MKKFFLKLLFRLYSPNLTEMGELDRLDAFMGMNKPEIINLLKARYTDYLSALPAASDKEAELFKGGMAELMGLVRHINSAQDDLINIRERMAKTTKRNQSNQFKGMMFGIKKFISSKK